MFLEFIEISVLFARYLKVMIRFSLQKLNTLDWADRFMVRLPVASLTRPTELIARNRYRLNDTRKGYTHDPFSLDMDKSMKFEDFRTRSIEHEVEVQIAKQKRGGSAFTLDLRYIGRSISGVVGKAQIPGTVLRFPDSTLTLPPKTGPLAIRI